MRRYLRPLQIRSWERLCWSCRPRRSYQTVSAADLQFGQPLHETHPHLLRAGEVTPGISALEYAQRRANLARALPPGSIAVLAAADTKYRSGAVFYDFHQDPDFFYLTGFNEPEALAVIEKIGPNDENVFHLYVRPKDRHEELWEGARSGVEAAEDVFNADVSGDVKRVSSILPEIVGTAKQVFTDIPTQVVSRSPLTQYLSGVTPARSADGLPDALKSIESRKVHTLRSIMNNLRVVKSEAEIANMRTAGKASGRAITDAMRKHFTSEKLLGAFIDHQFKLNGCDGQAYIPVIAGGRNSLSIHYVRNDDVLKDDEMVLVDAGGEYGGYITDITRSWPVSGRFSPAQKDLYQAILAVQRTCVSLCREDSGMSLDKIHDVAERGLKDNLKQLGFDMSGDSLRALFPHHLGHYIGLDVHDSPGQSRRIPLKTGMCITIEPGIYVTDDERWPAHFRNIGIRIEDSICIQEESPLILTTEAVKEVVDIEALRD